MITSVSLPMVGATCSSTLQRTADPAQLHVLRRLDAEEHLRKEPLRRLGKAGRKYPQKSVQLRSHFERGFARIHRRGSPLFGCDTRRVYGIRPRKATFHLCDGAKSRFYGASRRRRLKKWGMSRILGQLDKVNAAPGSAGGGVYFGESPSGILGLSPGADSARMAPIRVRDSSPT